MLFESASFRVRPLIWVLLGCSALETQAFLPPTRPQLPNFDKRAAQASDEAAVTNATATLAQWQAQLPQVQVDFDLVTGAPKWITAGTGLLAPAKPDAQAVATAVTAIASSEAYEATKAFVADHRTLFGFGRETLDQAPIKREFVTAHNGLRTVIWEQQLDGIPLFEGLFISHTTRNGELVNVSSQFLPDPAGAADRGTPNRAAVLADPGVSARNAVAIAARNVGEEVEEQQFTPVAPVAGAPAPLQFAGAGILGPADTKLVWLPMSKDTLRLCWEVIFTSRTRSEMFQVLVDAQNGALLVRHGLTDYISDATYRVYTSDSPSPFSPGHPTPLTNQPPFVSRVLIVTNAFDTNASPSGWIDDGGNETRGNNVDAHTDRDANDQADLPRPQGSPFRVFDFTLDLTQAPSVSSNAAVTQLFFLCNWYHDRVYELGFTEAAGNFQSNNFGRGGVGNDAVQADAQDGSGVNNANFSTPPDGSPGRMQMYVFNGPNPDRDGDLDAEVVFHEHTHGLSNRRVGGGVGISALQTGGMGEGWSDFYALCFLADAGDDVNGNYATGGYVTWLLSGLTNNYYYGIRRYPYTTDLSKDPLTFKDIDTAQASAHTGIPRNPVISNTANEVHNQGQVWCTALWEARAALINKMGFAGNQLILQLVTDGMNLSPPNPTFLQARDAIIQADLVDTGGTNGGALWTAFAKRGMGFSATSPASSTTTGVHEAFDLPDDLQIKPAAGFVAIGPVGGPFSPNSLTLAISNAGIASFNWSLVNTSPWLTLSPSNGTLLSGGSVSVAATLTAVAATLAQGVYSASVLFSNAATHVTQTRVFSVRPGQLDYFTQLFDTEPNNLSFQTFTFTPDGSAGFYSACRAPATIFPTDPAGGTAIALADDSFLQVTLAGTNTVSIYGRRTNVFFIGSNGYLTLNSGDTTVVETLAAHFNRPRVSALFDDLNPETGGNISWKQLADRVAVTYRNIPEYPNTGANSFQIELFADGRIRVTWLALSALDGLAGLSAGTGVPAMFLETILNSYATCAGAPQAVVGSPALVNGAFLFSVIGGPGLPYVVEASTNLTDWAPFQTNLSPFTITNVPEFPVRFFRAR